jgi:hypothetical protein
MNFSSLFFQSFLDDFLAVPTTIGILEYIASYFDQKISNSRRILFGFVGSLWFSLLFEMIIPSSLGHGTSDNWDILAYGLGAISYILIYRDSSNPSPNKE